MKATKTIYGVSMDILYIIAIFAWKLCRTNLRSFTTFKALYTDQLIKDALAAVEAAKVLKTSRQATAARKSARLDLVDYSKIVRQFWQDLKGYITTAYPDKAKANIELESAGALLYKKGQVNWSAVSGLISAANTYIADNLTILTANDNMPKSFQTDFEEAGTLFTDQLDVFQLADLDKKNAVSNKAKANNSIYNSLINMLKDGQLIFKNDETLKQQFTYEFLVAMNKGGVASLRGIIRDENDLPIIGATIESTNNKYTATTNDKGRYDITRMEAGDYTFVVVKDGNIRLQVDIAIKPGQANTLDIVLRKAMQIAA